MRDEGYQSDSDTGLQLLGHRYYDPSTGRFLTRDPIGDGRNWYVYCDNNPTSGVDPDGLIWGKLFLEGLKWVGRKIFGGAVRRGATRAASQAGKQFSSPILNGIKSLRNQIAKHRKKLDDYRKNPDAFDNLGLLKKAKTQAERDRIIIGRIDKLKKEIDTLEKEVAKLEKQLKEG